MTSRARLGATGRPPVIPASLRRLLRNLSIRRKLTPIVMVTSGVAVILASAAFLAYDYVAFRAQMVTDLRTTADGLGLLAGPALDAESAAAGVATQAQEALAFFLVSLRAYPSVEEGCIFDAEGAVVARHLRGLSLGSRPPPAFSTDTWHAFPGRGPRPLQAASSTPDGRQVGVDLPALEHPGAHRPASSATWGSSPR